MIIMIILGTVEPNWSSALTILCVFFVSVVQCENDKEVWQSITLFILSCITHFLICVFMLSVAAYSREDANCDMFFLHRHTVFKRSNQTPSYWTNQRNYWLITLLLSHIGSMYGISYLPTCIIQINQNVGKFKYTSPMDGYGYCWQTNLDFAHVGALGDNNTVSLVRCVWRDTVCNSPQKTWVWLGQLETLEVAPFRKSVLFSFSD